MALPAFGLGNFAYDVDVENGNAKYKFWDPEDTSNTAEVSLSKSDYPEGITQADSREVADLAYAKLEKQLNAKRDNRLALQTKEQTDQRISQERASREASNSFLADAEHGTSKPDKVEKDKDGNVTSNVYTSGDDANASKDKK